MTSKQIMAKVLKLEAESIQKAVEKLNLMPDLELSKLMEIYDELQKEGRSLIFCGVGKSGIIAMKLASTFSSLGLSSFFLHPTEALHGDLGRVSARDAIVFISKSGTTEEILKLLPYLPIAKARRISLLGNINSKIAEQSEINFDCSVEKEACINNQAPTTSSTTALAMGDALSVLFESQIQLSKESFAVNHPGGILGKSLRMKVSNIMVKKEECPIVGPNQTLQDVILKMTKYPVGGCAVVKDEKFIGILVEGDIRRTFTKSNIGLNTVVQDIVNINPISISPDDLASVALEKMETKARSISILPVVLDNQFMGFIRLHDLLKEGFSLNQ